jgi:predicted transposase YbfD/YdcC
LEFINSAQKVQKKEKESFISKTTKQQKNYNIRPKVKYVQIHSIRKQLKKFINTSGTNIFNIHKINNFRTIKKVVLYSHMNHISKSTKTQILFFFSSKTEKIIYFL